MITKNTWRKVKIYAKRNTGTGVITYGTPRQPSTAYSLYDLRSNSGNIYHCVQAGTSGSGSGPTGTTKGITDGTVKWDYVWPDGLKQANTDGQLKVWVDDVVRLDFTKIMWTRTPSYQFVERAWMNIYHGGTTPTTLDIDVFISDVKIWVP